ncbi:hypothetical protein GGP41_009426 [Bipolaris sorokiniana]|uniref:Cytochrome P450 n=1 Tax=Cochliobolus sativus TaxID=45130 RepID=A0A8H6DRS1_COCSA|nr:hypothetical protein GGP41_009426 [Bipolaris sorokiniana]
MACGFPNMDESSSSLTLTTVYRMLRGGLEVAQNKLHKKYGQLIGIVPEEVSCADASVIPLIYSSHSPLPKTDWYHIFTPTGLGENADLFSKTNEEKHTKHHKIVSPAYQMSSALRNETAIDECITLFTKRMRELAAKKEAINLGSFLNFYAHDVIGFVLFGHRFGYLEAGGDVGSFLNALDKAVPFIYVIAAVPNYIRKVLMFLSIFIPGTVGHLQAIQAISDAAKEQTQLRMERSTQEKNLQLRIVETDGADKGFTHRDVTLESWAGLMAGSDSIVSTMNPTV